MLHNRAAQAAIVVLVLGIIAAIVWSGLSHGPRPRPLPEGTQTLTGALLPAELSLTRRGTHVVQVDGENVAYAESSVVNLRLYELTQVAVTGTYVHNTDPSDLPVLVVSSLRAIEIPAVPVDVPGLGITVRVPAEWNARQFDDGVAFSLTGSTNPILRVSRSSLTRLPHGTNMFVGGFDAVRVDDGKGEQTVYLQIGRDVLTFTWTPSAPSQSPAFAQMLRTLTARSTPVSSQSTLTGGFLQMPSSAAASQAIDGAVYGQPCGGPAGVLCPAGSFCSVNSPDGVGTCAPLR